MHRATHTRRRGVVCGVASACFALVAGLSACSTGLGVANPRAPQTTSSPSPTSSPVVTPSGATSTTTTPVPSASPTTAAPVPKPTAKPFDVDTVMGGIRALARSARVTRRAPPMRRPRTGWAGSSGRRATACASSPSTCRRGVLGRTRASRATRQRHRRPARLRPLEAARRHRRPPRHRAPVSRGRGQRVGYHGHGGGGPDDPPTACGACRCGSSRSAPRSRVAATARVCVRLAPFVASLSRPSAARYAGWSRSTASGCARPPCRCAVGAAARRASRPRSGRAARAAGVATNGCTNRASDHVSFEAAGIPAARMAACRMPDTTPRATCRRSSTPPARAGRAAVWAWLRSLR